MPSSLESLDFRPLSPPLAHRIAFILPWFGRWPNWMPLFWESCRWNPNIRWLIYTDQVKLITPLENVEFISVSVREFYAHITQSLGITLKSLAPHKLCDLRVTYGVVFQDKLKDFAFWGMCDLDMVWGHIRTFYTDALLSEYDILTSSRCSINGQCTLFRNTPHVNNLFLKIPNVRDLMQHPRYCGLDEVRINETALKEEKAGTLKTLRRQLLTAETWDFWEEASELMEFNEKGSLVHYPRLIGSCRWEAGRVFHIASGKEMVLFHFLWGKKPYAKHGRSYPYWDKYMIGWEMNRYDIVMLFKPGQTRVRLIHYLTTRWGATTWNVMMQPVRDFWNFREMREWLKRKCPWMIPLYEKIFKKQVNK
jgi:hypothetical protein